ncbi:dTMP kinase [Paenibacillus shirakamiensis]|uniref:Thymidylate kinase n=1 Tax=Paenibacillus shirakamiensis TaxID=1265935 RepID=A0ABS4JNF7_9BACL|nr:dTMP kinase [Paenibacillus shirakamiensis]MBP2002681.1 dTMP kinase [Paenibacillus shirakamiensis]
MLNKQGYFITFEGGEGSGKTTVIHSIAEHLKKEGVPTIITREPGGIEISEKIRGIILDPEHTQMDGRTEALLYAAARRQHLVERVIPALQAGNLVLCDRFIDSSLAYQGYARGLGIDEILAVNSFATEGRMPDTTFYLDIEPSIGLSRIEASQGREVNRLDLEQLEFHQLVRKGYLSIAERFSDRILTINAERDVETVISEIMRHLEPWIKGFRGE